MNTPPDFHSLIDDLSTKGYAFREQFFSAEFCQKIRNASQNVHFKEATIGKGSEQKRVQEIRTDSIYWLESDSPEIFQNYLQFMDDYRQILNRELYLGLKSFEGHLAKYPKGAFYKKHLDQHRGSKDRVITTILYLNGGSDKNSGGEIRLYQKDHPELIEQDIPPSEGAFLTFLSDEIYHEVLTSHFERFSLTGWMRINQI